jgi:hypothetical protein
MEERPSIENIKTELLNILESKIPIQTELMNFIKKIKDGNWESKAYIYFLNSKNPNQPNSEWQFKENLILESEIYGPLILDILSENKLGGIEFLNNLK